MTVTLANIYIMLILCQAPLVSTFPRINLLVGYYHLNGGGIEAPK